MKHIQGRREGGRERETGLDVLMLGGSWNPGAVLGTMQRGGECWPQDGAHMQAG